MHFSEDKNVGYVNESVLISMEWLNLLEFLPSLVYWSKYPLFSWRQETYYFPKKKVSVMMPEASTDARAGNT